MSNYRKQLGDKGERAAEEYLRGLGYEIVESDVTFWGGQLDMVCRKGATIVFVEVKTRTHSDCQSAPETLSYRQLKTIIRAARLWLYGRKIYENDHYWQVDLLYCHPMADQWAFELFSDVAFLR